MLIAQISDLHLRQPGVRYHDVVDSNAMAAEAIAQLGALEAGTPDVVLVSGDVVDTGAQAEYQLAQQLLDQVEQPLVLIPGNHDDREGFRAAFAHRARWGKSGPLHSVTDDVGPVRIIGFDITVPGEHHGDVTTESGQWLEATLAEQPDRPTIVMLHQHPFATGIGYIDLYDCRRADVLADIVHRHPQIVRVTCGHVHRHMTLGFGGTILTTAPSTTTAISLRLQPDAQPASRIEPPGMLLHHWSAEHGLVTHHVPVGEFDGPYPFA